jgi:hypothetical protein
MRQNRVPKPPQQQLADLEDHLYLLRQHMHLLQGNVAHIKALAAELRVLVCRTGRSDEGLVWRLTKEYAIDQTVHVHYAGAVNPDHPLARGLHFAVVHIARPDPTLEPVLPAGTFDLQGLIEQGEAVYIAGKSYTHEQLIRAVAEQMGSAHEDEGVEFGLAALRDILLNGVEPYFEVLAIDAELTLEIGERILEAGENKLRYVRRQLPSPMTVSLLIKLFQPVLGSLLIGGGTFYIAGTRIEVCLRPKSITFVILKNLKPTELSAQLPEAFKRGETIAFCLDYDPKTRVLKTLSSLGVSESAQRNLGALDGREFCPDRRTNKLAPYARCVAFLVHEKQFTEDEVRQLPEILIEPPNIDS